MRTRIAILLLANVTLTILTAQAVGPAASKLQEVFGLVGWAARIPFYVLPLYIGPVILWVQPRISTGIIVGLLMAVPLALWSVATKCPPLVPVVYAISGAFQGGLLSWLARRLER